jgi:ribonuclease R
MTKNPFSKKLYNNLLKTIQQFMRGKRYQPMGQVALFKRLKLPSSLYPLGKQILADLTQQDLVHYSNKRFSLKKGKADAAHRDLPSSVAKAKPSQKPFEGKGHKKEQPPPSVEKQIAETSPITGIVRMHPRGFGFVIPDEPQYQEDIFIPKHLTDNAVDGDKVEVIVAQEAKSDKGPEGRIVGILKRGRSHLAGTILSIDEEGNAISYVPILGQTKRAFLPATPSHPFKVGERIFMKVVRWGEEQNEWVECSFDQSIGHISDPSCDILAAIKEFDIREAFPKSALNQAKSFGDKVLKKDLQNREDLSSLESVTIDPDTAKDFDDALSITKDRKGHYHLGVHIADVAHYVSAFSPLDMEAILRCNSTYFPGRCVPMLPEELSNQLCSLKPKVTRLTVSVLMSFDKMGNVLNYKISRAAIKSRKRFTYKEAKEVLDKKIKSPHAKALKLMVELCHLLKAKRHERGSIDFAMPELIIEVDKKGVPVGIKWVEYDITHQLVEEFMLKANEIVATELSRRGVSLIYRIHEEPSEENMSEFFALARTLGFPLSEKPSVSEIQQLFEAVKKTPFAQQLSVSFIRSMKLAYYSSENVGHYGLSLEHYCHFTSPIRRYSDLVIQRLLFDEQPEPLDLEKIALKCSEQERISFKAEMSVKTLKKLRLLQSFHRDDAHRIYPAVVTKVKPFGLFFELPELVIEGFLHISELEDDYFIFIPERNILKGRSSGKTHGVGEKIQIKLLAIDLILLETKWELLNTRKRK